MTRYRIPALFIFALLLRFSLTAVFAQDATLLSVERIFKGNEFAAESFNASWDETESKYIARQPSGRPCGGFDIVRKDPLTDEATVLVRAEELIPGGESRPLDFASFEFSANNSHLLLFTNTKKVWRRHTKGDYWVLDRAAGLLKKLGRDARPSSLQFAKFSPNGKSVAYVCENNIYIENLLTGSILPLTDDGGERFINGTFDWVYEEELDLRDGFWWSPDGTAIAYWQLDTEGVPVFSMINNTDSLYPKVVEFKYPKAGTTNAAGKVGIVRIPALPNAGAIPEGAEKLVPGASGIKTQFTTDWIKIEGDPREHYIVDIKWLGDDLFFMSRLNRLQNEIGYYCYDLSPGGGRVMDGEADETWIDYERPIWLAGNRRFLALSERSGWRHFRMHSIKKDGENFGYEKSVQITNGDFDVIGFAGFDREESGSEVGIYFYASPENAARKYLYRVGIDGAGIERITPEGQPGTHSYSICPKGKLAVHTVSRFGEPPVSELVELPSHKTVKVLQENERLRGNLAKLRPVKEEFFTVETNDGISIDGWAIFPPDFDPDAKYPVLVHVYGEPAGQTVLDRWGGSGYLWHRMMAEKGYVVLSFDNRGTPAPKGREWRKSVYRKLGEVVSKDQFEALEKTLQERTYLDGDRVGIWGWSGGGTSSLHALFRHPERYKLAVAVAAVPHERYYDTIYQERYLGMPDDNLEGYRASSPITFAENMKGKLLLVHGTGDDNCHYQTLEVLINELVRHGKQFQLMSYPNRSHSINEGEGTTLHLRTLMTEFIERNL